MDDCNAGKQFSNLFICHIFKLFIILLLFSPTNGPMTNRKHVLLLVSSISHADVSESISIETAQCSVRLSNAAGSLGQH